MRVVVIDDEEIAIEVLERMLSEIDGVEIVGKYTDAALAKEELPQLDADLLFLDMEMGGHHGLRYAKELLDNMNGINVVFVTAYSQYALEAFEVNALDYLLKPVKAERLIKTISRLKENSHKVKLNEKTIESLNLSVHLLGSFKLFDAHNSLVKWRTKKVRELFAYLLHNQDKPISRARIMEDLWPEQPADKAAAILHTTVYQLRKTLKELTNTNPLTLHNEHYILELAVKSDLLELKSLLNAPKISGLIVRDILSVYYGAYLEEENYSWAIREQQEVKQQVLQCLEHYLLQERTNNELAPLQEICLMKMLQIDPYNETYAYYLMDYYKNVKNKRKLIDFYTKFQKKLLEELGVSLNNKLVKLYKSYNG